MRVTSSRPCRLRCIWLSGAGKQACQVRNKCHSWNVHIWPHYGCIFLISTRAWNPSNRKAHLTKWTDMLHLKFWIKMIIKHWGMLFLCADEKQSFLLLFSLDSHGCGQMCTVEVTWRFLCRERWKHDGIYKNVTFTALPNRKIVLLSATFKCSHTLTHTQTHRCRLKNDAYSGI